MDDPERKRRSATSFGEASDAYSESVVHREGTDLDTLASWYDGATRALDVACGAGHAAGALLQAGVPTVVAADASPEMVWTATDAFDCEGVVADAERLPFPADGFDAVTCRIAAHHFPDPRAFVREVDRVLSPGGTFAFEDNVAPEDGELAAFFNRFEAVRDPSHVEALPCSRWVALLRDTGFTVQESVTMERKLDYDAWVERTDPSAEQRETLAELVRRPEAEQVYGVTVEDGTVRGFSNRKGLFRARATR